MFTQLKQRSSLIIVALFLFVPGLVADLMAEDDWPMWRRDSRGGPVAQESQLRDPKLTPQTHLWVSEIDVPSGRNSDGRGKSGRNDMQQPASGGYASPIAADGKVFHWNYRPSGTVYDKARAKALGMSQDALRAQAPPLERNLVIGHERWLVSATDVLTAIDAQTGKTLWHTELTDEGVNFGFFNKGGGGITPVYHDGMVIALGTAAQVFGVDAETGELKWTHNLMPRHEQNKAYRQEAMTGQGIAPRFNRDFLSALVAADGLVIVNDQRLHRIQTSAGTNYHYDIFNHYLALDVHTGEVRWDAAEVGDMKAAPVIWEHQGEKFVLGINRFHISLIDLASGDILWRADAGHQAHFDLAVNEQYVVMNARSRDGNGKELKGYSIDRSGMKELWTWGKVPYDSNVVLVGDRGYMHMDNHLRCFDAATGETITEVPIGRIATNYNPFIAYYRGWLITMGGDAGNGYSFLPADPELMQSGMRFFPADISRGYGDLIFPAFLDGKMFYRTQDSSKIEAYQLE